MATRQADRLAAHRQRAERAAGAARSTAAAAKAGRPVLAVPPGPLGTFPPQTLRPGLGGRGRLLDRRRADERDRHRRLRRRRPGVGVRPPARGRRPARAAAAGRVRLPRHQQPAAARRDRLDLQARGLRARPRDAHLRRLQRASPGASARCRTRCRSTAIARDLDAQGRHDGQHDAGRRGRGRPAERRLVDVVRRAARRRRRPPAACSAARPARLTGEMCARIALAELKKPLRFCNRYVSTALSQGDDGGASQRRAQRRGERPRRRARDDRRLHGHAAARDRRQRAAQGPPRRRPGVHAQRSRCPRSVRPGQRVRARVSLQRVRGGTLTRTYTLRIPSRRAPRHASASASSASDADAGRRRLHDDHPRRRRAATNEGGDPGPATLDELADQVKATGALRRRERCASAAPARDAFRDDDFRISGQAETTVASSGALGARSGRRCPAGGARRPACGSAARRTAANASVDAAIISISVSTGVASSLTPLA